MDYLSANDYFRERFGCKLYKLALDGGMTCPNRDGTKGCGGCIFCSASGSGDFAEPRRGSVTEQLERAKARVASKAKNARYIAYFQSFTNTYAPVDYLERLFSQAIAHPDVAALAVATRPDCLPEPVLELLGRLDRQKPVIVELGLQTIHPDTAEFIRRGCPLADYDRAVAALNARGIHTVVHMILGLPGESEDMMVQTARYIGQSGAGGIKLQLLHVLRGTDLADLWRQGRVPVMNLEQYAHAIGRCLQALPPETVVHRLTGDGPKKDLLAPLWTGNKKAVMNYVNQYLRGL
jgi:radical SAM protein (TIGR01212 family)